MKRTDIEKIDNVIKALTDLRELLLELAESVKYEQCEYHVVRDPSNHNMFALYRIKDEKRMCWSTKSGLLSYTRLHGIDINKIHNSKILE